MDIQDIVNSEDVKSIMDNYRSMCFWSFPEDFMPQNKEQLVLALECLERYGDRDAYCKAGEIRQWL